MSKDVRMFIKEFAAQIRVSVRTVYRMENSGQIPPHEKDVRGHRRYTTRHIKAAENPK